MSTLAQTDPVIQPIADWLEANQWKVGEVSPHSYGYRRWYRFYEVTPMCFGNSNQPGVLVSLKMWDHRQYGGGVSFEVALIAEPDDGVWVELLAYGIDAADVKAKLDGQVAKLIRAWQAVQTP